MPATKTKAAPLVVCHAGLGCFPVAYPVFPPSGILDQLPAAVVHPPEIERTQPDGRERTLGRNDWLLGT